MRVAPLGCAGRRRSASVSRSTCDLGAASAAEERRIRRRSLGKSPASAPLRASGVDPLLTCNSAETADKAYLQEFSSPLTDSNRRPPPYHGTSPATGGSR